MDVDILVDDEVVFTACNTCMHKIILYYILYILKPKQNGTVLEQCFDVMTLHLITILYFLCVLYSKITDLPFCTRVLHRRKEGDGWHSSSASLGWISGILLLFALKNFVVDLSTEELKLREAQALENQQQAHMALLEAKKIASHSIKRKQTSASQVIKPHFS